MRKDVLKGYPVELIPTEILSEISDYKKRNCVIYLDTGFFNNFEGFLPGGFYYNYISQNPDSNLHAEEESELRKSINLGEFLAECQKACNDAGFSNEEIIEARRKYRGNYNDKTYYQNERDFFQKLLPIYVILRQRGFKRYPDLTI